MDNFSFVALDIETATGKRSSICEIGITIVKDSKIAESKSWLIQPKDNSYWRRNIEIHGINPEDTQNKPTLADIWEEIKGYIENYCCPVKPRFRDFSSRTPSKYGT